MTNLVFFSTHAASSPKLDFPYDSFPPFDLSQFKEYECSVQLFLVSENRTVCFLDVNRL